MMLKGKVRVLSNPNVFQSKIGKAKAKLLKAQDMWVNSRPAGKIVTPGLDETLAYRLRAFVPTSSTHFA